MSHATREYLSIMDMSPNMETNLARKIDNVIPLQHKWYQIRTIDEDGIETLSDVVKL
eukprot:Pgem_evm1s15667